MIQPAAAPISQPDGFASAHIAVVKMFEKHYPNGMWLDEDVETVKKEITRSLNSRAVSVLLDAPLAFEILFLSVRRILALKSNMAMYCGEEKALALFQEWQNGGRVLTEDDAQMLIDQAHKNSCIPEAFKHAVSLQFEEESNPPDSPPASPCREVVNLSELLFKQEKKRLQEKHAELIFELQIFYVEKLGDFQPKLQRVFLLAFACALDHCWEYLASEPEDMESRLKKLIASELFDNTFHHIVDEFLKEESLLENLNLLLASPLDAVRAFLKEENYPDPEGTCHWIAKDLKELLKAYQSGEHYKKAMTPAEILDQFHREVRGSCNRQTLVDFFDELEKHFPRDVVDAILEDWYLIGTDVRDGRAFLTPERVRALWEHVPTFLREREVSHLEARVKNRLSRGDLILSAKNVEKQFPELAIDPYFRRSIPVDFLVKQALVATSIKNPARFAVTDGERFAFLLLGMDVKKLEEVKLNTYQKIAAALRNSGHFTEEKLKTQTAHKIKEEIDQIALQEKLRMMEQDIGLTPKIRALVRFYSEVCESFKPAMAALNREMREKIDREHGVTLLSQYLKKQSDILCNRHFHTNSLIGIKQKVDAIKNGLRLTEKDFDAILKGLAKELFSEEALQKLSQSIGEKVITAIDKRAAWTKKWNNPWEFEMQQGLNDEQECLVDGICWAICSRLSLLEQKQPELTHEQQKKHFTIQPCDRFYQASYSLHPRSSDEDRVLLLPKQISDKLGIQSVDPHFLIQKPNFAELCEWLQSEEVQQAEGICHLGLHGSSGADRWGHANYIRCDLKRGIFYFFDPNGGKSKPFKPAAGESSEQVIARMLTCYFEWLDAEYPDCSEIVGYTFSLTKQIHEKNTKMKSATEATPDLFIRRLEAILG